MGDVKIGILPLCKFPTECLPFSGPFHKELRELRSKCLQVEGYFMVRDTFGDEHGGVIFEFSDTARLKADLSGQWLLGRIHQVGLSYHFSIFAWDAVSKEVNRYCYVKTAYGPRSVRDTIRDLNTLGTREVFDNDNMFTWTFKPSKGLFSALEGKVNEPNPAAASS